jgi:hypothetical protein
MSNHKFNKYPHINHQKKQGQIIISHSMHNIRLTNSSTISSVRDY